MHTGIFEQLKHSEKKISNLSTAGIYPSLAHPKHIQCVEAELFILWKLIF